MKNKSIIASVKHISPSSVADRRPAILKYCPGTIQGNSIADLNEVYDFEMWKSHHYNVETTVSLDVQILPNDSLIVRVNSFVSLTEHLNQAMVASVLTPASEYETMLRQAASPSPLLISWGKHEFRLKPSLRSAKK